MASLRSYCTCFLSLALFAASLSAQETPTLHKAPASTEPETPSIHVDVKEVTVPVTVRDKHGKLVQNLAKDDFVLLQDTKPQTITNLRHDTNLPLTLGLLVDTSRSMSNELSAEKGASQKFLDEMLKQPKDQAFLIHFDKEVELLQDLTSSRDKLYNALSLLETARSDSTDDSTRSSGGDGGQSRRRHGGTQLYDAVYLACTEVLKKQQGRKAIIILSDGQDRGSKETLNDAIEYAQRADTTVYAIYFKGEEQQRRGFGDRDGSRGGMGGPRIGFPGGGGGYPGGGGGYPGGGRRGGRDPEGPKVDGKKILTEIATKTGGQMFEVSKKETIDQIYSEIAEELRDQMVLAYTPDTSSIESGYHRITLTAKNKEMKVQAREGFYIPEPTEAAK
jgi:VWFA-related protein